MLVPLLVMAVGVYAAVRWLLLLRMRTALNERKIEALRLYGPRRAPRDADGEPSPPRLGAALRLRHGSMLPGSHWHVHCRDGRLCGFVWPAYAVAVAVLGGLALAFVARLSGQRKRRSTA